MPSIPIRRRNKRIVKTGERSTKGSLYMSQFTQSDISELTAEISKLEVAAVQVPLTTTTCI